jgi:3-phenylpropionate/trans-cinnamate dioxygenase ferredoxin reductase subunit
LPDGRDHHRRGGGGLKSVVIVGAGLAGARCAETLRTLGFDGRVVLVGEEPVPPYERPALSKEFLLGGRSVDDLLLRPQTFWDAQAIELVVGEHVVAARDGVASTASGTAFAYDALVVATGARPRRLPDMPAGVHVLRTLADAEALRGGLGAGRRLAIVGGGFVGAEVASSASTLGLDVVLIEAGHAPFASLLGRDVAEILTRRYRRHGIDVKTRVSVRRFETHADGRLSHGVLNDGSDVSCDLALVAVGVRPERDLLERTSSTVLICGDAAGGGHWTGAAHDGAGVAHTLLELARPPAPPSYFWSDQFGLRLQLVGTTRGAAGVDLDGDDDAFVARYVGDEGTVLGALAVNRPRDVPALRRELPFAA